VSVLAKAQAAAEAQAVTFQWDPYARGAPSGRPRRVPGRPLNVVLADVRKSLFKDLHDPRLNVLWLDDPGASAADLLVLDGINGARALGSGAAVPEETWARIAHGQAKVVFDGSGEGIAHTPSRSDGFHRVLRQKGLGPDAAVYVTQDRGYADAYAAWLEAQGLTGPGMTVLVYDRFIQAAIAGFHDKGAKDFKRRFERWSRAPDARPRRFICLNHMMRPARTLYLLRLIQRGLFDQGFVSMGQLAEVCAGPEARGAFEAELKAFEGFGALAAELLPLLDDLIAYGPSTLGIDGPVPYGNVQKERIRPSSLEQSLQSWFTVVTETDFGNRMTRITEKPLKPLLDFHPFVVLGGPGSLRLIRAYGFRTFPGIFDERYDDEPDPRTRFEMVSAEAERLCRMPQADLARLVRAADEDAVFNAWWGMVQLPRLFRSRIDAPLVDRLVELCSG
jgi:hypothetical protein